ncbi:MAG: heparinase II/III family protein [Abditibacteriota bacterium]|nr:heparinase II/III family protein [Abditibacteriota bacterium]
MLFEKERQPEYWLTMREDPEFARRLREVDKAYETAKTIYRDVINDITYTSRHLTHITGERDQFEEPMLVRRDLMHASGILALAYPEEKRYLDSFHDAVWALCEEECWMLPAHYGSMLFHGDSIDLTSSLTGGAMAELLWFLGDRVDEEVRQAAAREIRRQVIEPYKNHTIHWENTRHNWGSVCGCGVAATLMYQDPEEFERQKPRLLKTIETAFSGYPSDGTCLEGIGYWEYGFGHWAAFAHLLKQYTDGAMDLFRDPAVEKVAGFGPKQYLLGDCTVSYGDGERDKHLYSGLAEFLRTLYPGSVPLLPRERKNYGFVRHWFTFRLQFLAFAGDLSGPIENRDYYFESGGQFVVNRKGYSLAAKAGYNNEPHNHNDAGSFILSDDSGQVFCDVGVGCYNRTYFMSDTRYGVLCNSSRGHSVPIINGCYQKEGNEFSADMEYREGSCDIDISRAYNIPGISAKRRLEWTDDSIRIRDCFDRVLSVTERFVTLLEPRIEGNRIYVGNWVLTVESPALQPSVSSELHRRRGPVGVTDLVYMIDVPLPKGQKEASFLITRAR